MPRHSGNRDAADRPNSSVHGGFSRRPRQEVILPVATRYLRKRNVCKWQWVAGSRQQHHRGTANECHGADAPSGHTAAAPPSNEMNSRRLMGLSLQPKLRV
jgi:hypothetical protein